MSIRIGIGNSLVPTLSPAEVWRWAEACDDCGLDSLWVSDQPSGPAPEPLAMLAALAARTRRIRLGTNVLVVSLREPILLARQLATIHALSGGRLLPAYGIGTGGDPLWAATGTDPASRGKRANEAIALVCDLLTRDAVSFEGSFHRYAGAGIQPRPERALPCWIGGESEAAIRRTALLGDGWIGGLSTPERVGATIAAIKAKLAENGRTIDADHYGATIPFRIGAEDDPAVPAARERLAKRLKGAEREGTIEGFAVGTANHIIGIMRRYIEQGVAKFVVLPIASDGADLMEQTRLLAERIVPEIEVQR